MKYFDLPPLFEVKVPVSVSDTDSLRMSHFLKRLIPSNFKNLGDNIHLVEHMVSRFSKIEGDPQKIAERQLAMKWMFSNPKFLKFVSAIYYGRNNLGDESQFKAYSQNRKNAANALDRMFSQIDGIVEFFLESEIDILVGFATKLKNAVDSNRRLSIMRSISAKNQLKIDYCCLMELSVSKATWSRKKFYILTDETMSESISSEEEKNKLYKKLEIDEANSYVSSSSLIIPSSFFREFGEFLFKKHRSVLQKLSKTSGAKTISVKFEAQCAPDSFSGITGSFTFPNEAEQFFYFDVDQKGHLKFVLGKDVPVLNDRNKNYLENFYGNLHEVATTHLQGSLYLFNELEILHREFIESILDVVGYAGILQGLKDLVGERSELVCWPELLEAGKKDLKFEDLKNMILCLSGGLEGVVGNEFFDNQSVILTGANANGKSNWLNAISYGYIFGQAGLPVIGKQFAFSPVSSIFTHYVRGAEGDFDESRFQDELVRLRFIFDNLDKGSVLFFDESFTGTRSQDGIDQSLAVLEIAQELGLKVFFSTHFSELTEMSDVLNTYKNYHAKIRYKNNQPICSYKIVPGISEINTEQFLTKNMGLDSVGLRKIIKARKLV